MAMFIDGAFRLTKLISTKDTMKPPVCPFVYLRVLCGLRI